MNCETDQLLAYLEEQFPATVGHLPLRELLKERDSQFTSLQRELEEVKKENIRLKNACTKEFTDVEQLSYKLAASEAKCERMKSLIDRIACSNHPKYVNCEVAWQEIAGTCAAMRDEPPSTSLDLYHKERNKKELGEVMRLLSYARAKTSSLTLSSVYIRLGEAVSILKRLTE